MIKSMTGFGSAKGLSGDLEISVEIKCVNNRYHDCSIKLPRVFMSFEESLKSVVQKYISRGKTDVYVTIDSSKSGDIGIRVNHPLASAYLSALHELADEHGLDRNVSLFDLAGLPDILKAEKREADPEKLCADVTATLEEAIAGLERMRISEGSQLRVDISSRLNDIERLTGAADEISRKSLVEYREKLQARMTDVLSSAEIDESRILLEAALFADRIAISEETVRLRSHISQMRGMLETSGPVGRKMDFLIQEFNREANTIGSKGNDAELARVVVDMKSEIEKMREQAQNIE